MIAVVALVGCGGGETKTCVYCKEPDIQHLAVICKHCGKDPDGPDGSEIRLESYKEEGEKKENEWGEWLCGFIGGTVFICLFGGALVQQYRTGKKELAEKDLAEKERAEVNQQKQDTD